MEATRMSAADFGAFVARMAPEAYKWRMASNTMHWHNGAGVGARDRQRASQTALEALVCEWADTIRGTAPEGDKLIMEGTGWGDAITIEVPLDSPEAQAILEWMNGLPQQMEIPFTDKNGCHTLPDGSCVSEGPCMHDH